MCINLTITTTIKSKELWSNFIKPYYTFKIVFVFNANPVNKYCFNIIF